MRRIIEPAARFRDFIKSFRSRHRRDKRPSHRCSHRAYVLCHRRWCRSPILWSRVRRQQNTAFPIHCTPSKSPRRIRYSAYRSHFYTRCTARKVSRTAYSLRHDTQHSLFDTLTATRIGQICPVGQAPGAIFPGRSRGPLTKAISRPLGLAIAHEILYGFSRCASRPSFYHGEGGFSSLRLKTAGTCPAGRLG